MVDPKSAFLQHVLVLSQAFGLKAVCYDIITSVLRLQKGGLSDAFPTFNALSAVLSAFEQAYIALNEPRLFASLIWPLKVDPNTSLTRKVS